MHFVVLHSILGVTMRWQHPQRDAFCGASYYTGCHPQRDAFCGASQYVLGVIHNVMHFVALPSMFWVSVRHFRATFALTRKPQRRSGSVHIGCHNIGHGRSLFYSASVTGKTFLQRCCANVFLVLLNAYPDYELPMSAGRINI